MHVDAFVCHCGEWGPTATFATYYYPAAATAAGLPCNTLCFPIEDFHVTGEAGVLALVLELRRWLHTGEWAYIHCRSGHGRTGMIATPLVAAVGARVRHAELSVAGAAASGARDR